MNDNGKSVLEETIESTLSPKAALRVKKALGLGDSYQTAEECSRGRKDALIERCGKTARKAALIASRDIRHELGRIHKVDRNTVLPFLFQLMATHMLHKELERVDDLSILDYFKMMAASDADCPAEIRLMMFELIGVIDSYAKDLRRRKDADGSV